MQAVALSSLPLREGEAFEVLLEAILPIEHGGLEIGVTSNLPQELDIPRTMTDCEIGSTYMLSHRTVRKNGKIVHVLDEVESTMNFKVRGKKEREREREGEKWRERGRESGREGREREGEGVGWGGGGYSVWGRERKV